MPETRPKAFLILSSLATLTWMGFILYLSSQPSSFYDHLVPWMRRFRHLMEYPTHFSLYFLLFQFSKGLLLWLGGPQGERKALLAAILFTSGFGMVDEIYQSTVPTRTCDPKDFLVDSLAALTGVLLHQLFSDDLVSAPSDLSYRDAFP